MPSELRKKIKQMINFISLQSKEAFEVVCKCLFVSTHKNRESGKHTTPGSLLQLYEYRTDSKE